MSGEKAWGAVSVTDHLRRTPILANHDFMAVALYNGTCHAGTNLGVLVPVAGT